VGDGLVFWKRLGDVVADAVVVGSEQGCGLRGHDGGFAVGAAKASMDCTDSQKVVTTTS
jgi:hypothetical protein